MSAPAPTAQAPDVSAPEAVTTPDLSFLVIGDSGTGKTKAISTLPRPFVFDFDKGMATHPVGSIEYVTIKDAPRGGKAYPARGIYEWGTGWGVFIDKLHKIGAEIDKGTWPHESLCFDSLTTMSDLCMNAVLKQDGKAPPPQIQHWGGFLNGMSSVIDTLTAWPGIKYLTAHVQRETNDLTQSVEMLPLISGQMKGKISIYFDEIYFAEVVQEGVGAAAKRKYVFRTQNSSIMKQARSRREVPDKSEQDFKAILKHIAKRG